MQYRYQQTSKIAELIQRLDQYQFFIQNAPIDSRLQQNMRHHTQLKSSLFSARIEGNRLTLNQIESGLVGTKVQEKVEIYNLLKALDTVFSSRAPAQLNQDFIRLLHQVAMEGLVGDAGRFRSEVTAIFNQSGVAVYITPPPDEIVSRLEHLIEYSQSNADNTYVRTAIAHYWFEKIHPFVDGNGRVGRLLVQYWLDRGGGRFQGLLSFEEQIEATRNDYYFLLQNESNDLTDFVEYMLECWVLTGEQLIGQLKKQPKEPSPEDLLLPRRKEILNLLGDHQYMSFDQIKRRFYGVKTSTLRYDLQKLIKNNLVVKIGVTRGAIYKASS